MLIRNCLWYKYSFFFLRKYKYSINVVTWVSYVIICKIQHPKLKTHNFGISFVLACFFFLNFKKVRRVFPTSIFFSVTFLLILFSSQVDDMMLISSHIYIYIYIYIILFILNRQQHNVTFCSFLYIYIYIYGVLVSLMSLSI